MKIEDQNYHFIGVGGIGMCGLAQTLHQLGARVTGSDLTRNHQTSRLIELGLTIYSKHSSENVGEANVVVYSNAISQDHVELIAARDKELKIVPRAEILSQLMKMKRGIAVIGSHGKTTTSSLLTVVLQEIGLNPSAVIGGQVSQLGATAVWSNEGEWFVAEADESDGSFHRLSPEVVLLTNIDDDHLDFYGSLEGVKKSFEEFILKVPHGGKVFLCGDDANIRSLLENRSDQVSGFNRERFKTYGFDEKNDFRIRASHQHKNKFDLYFKKEFVCQFGSSLPGQHNVLNSAGVLALAFDLGYSLSEVVKAIESFKGVGRRSEKVGGSQGRIVFDDYAHHPTEIETTISGFKQRFSDHHLVVCFQPHRYTRTKACWDRFLDVFGQADEVWIADIYSAGEKDIDGINSKKLAQEIKHSNCQWVSAEELLVDKIIAKLPEKSVFLTMGAGDIWKLGRKILGRND